MLLLEPLAPCALLPGSRALGTILLEFVKCQWNVLCSDGNALGVFTECSYNALASPQAPGSLTVWGLRRNEFKVLLEGAWMKNDKD